MATPIYVYKSYVYEVDHNPNTKTTIRQMRFLSSDSTAEPVIYNLDSYGELTLEEFKSIVEMWLDW